MEVSLCIGGVPAVEVLIYVGFGFVGSFAPARRRAQSHSRCCVGEGPGTPVSPRTLWKVSGSLKASLGPCFLMGLPLSEWNSLLSRRFGWPMNVSAFVFSQLLKFSPYRNVFNCSGRKAFWCVVDWSLASLSGFMFMNNWIANSWLLFSVSSLEILWSKYFIF